MRNLFVWGAVLFLTACGAHTQLPDVDQAAMEREAKIQRALALKEFVKFNTILMQPAFQVRRASVELCEDNVSYSFGLAMVYDGNDQFSEAAVIEFDVRDNALIYAIADGSPAAEAGLRVDDRITQINGQSLAGAHDAAISAIEDAMQSGAAVQLSIKRDAQAFNTTITPISVCGFPVQLINDQAVNAFADGERVMISKGMVRFVDSEDELALVIGHELAHNSEAHQDSKMGNAIVGAIFDGIAAGFGVNTGGLFSNALANANSQDFESEADYVGAYFAARAGYDVSNAAGLWRRMAASNPEAIHLAGTTHPSTAKRFLALEEASAEIKQRQEAGEDLIPIEASPPSQTNDYPGDD